jgi:hypothetical protein
MSEPERPPKPDASGPAPGPMGARRAPGPPPGMDAATRAAKDAHLRSLEDVYMRRGMIFVVVASIVFSFTVWGVSKLASERVPGPPPPREVSHALRGVYNAAYADGIRMFESDRPDELAHWLTGHVGPQARLPDLSAAGLTPSGVRILNLGKGWGMIQYRDQAGLRGDVLAVIAPRNAVLVPAEAAAEPVGAGKVYVMANNGLTFAWTETPGTDWVLVTRRDPAGALAAARAMLARPG